VMLGFDDELSFGTARTRTSNCIGRLPIAIRPGPKRVTGP
jgi:hypothetical protein